MEAADNLLLQQNSFLLGLSDGVKPEPPQLQESIFASQLAALSNNPYSSAALGRYLHLDVTHDHNMPLLQPPFMPGDPLHPTSSAGPTRSGSGGLSTSNESGNGLAPTAKTASGKPVKTPQKRFRERQKEKMSTLEQEVAAKTAEFERLAKENEKVKTLG